MSQALYTSNSPQIVHLPIWRCGVGWTKLHMTEDSLNVPETSGDGNDNAGIASFRLIHIHIPSISDPSILMNNKLHFYCGPSAKAML
jgi:hypothetical protein